MNTTLAAVLLHTFTLGAPPPAAGGPFRAPAANACALLARPFPFRTYGSIATYSPSALSLRWSWSGLYEFDFSHKPDQIGRVCQAGAASIPGAIAAPGAVGSHLLSATPGLPAAGL